MAVTITATAGSATANSYATEAQAIAYANERLNLPSTWTTITGSTLTTDAEKRALIEATRELDLVLWQGQRATQTQALAWPRVYVPDPDAPIAPVGGDYPYLADDAIPWRVWKATVELAFEFLRAGTEDVAALPDTADVVVKTVDVLETTFVDPAYRHLGLARFPRVVNLIAPLLSTRGSGLTVVRT